jgi:uncharacterized damage-inducible protein DinB
MMSSEQARTFARYNRWMNERLYECCARLTDAERKEDMRAFFGSIHGTLNHLLLGDRVWMARFTGGTFRPRSLAEELYTDFAELRAERAKTDDAIDAWTAALDERALASDLSYTSIVNPEPRRLPLWLAATHFFNHQTHHRGQLTTLLFQRGIDPGVTDLMWMPDVAGPRRA